MRTLPTLLMALAMGLPAGCDSQRNDPDATPPTAAANEAVPAPATDATDVTSHYDCGAGVSVALREDRTAKVTLPNQPAVELALVANSTPPVYAGANLFFTLDDAAFLSQENGTELACQSK